MQRKPVIAKPHEADMKKTSMKTGYSLVGWLVKSIGEGDMQRKEKEDDMKESSFC